MEGWASSYPQQQRKWIHTGVIHSLALCLEDTTDAALPTCMRTASELAPKSGRDGKWGPASGRTQLTAELPQWWQAEGPAPQEVACSHKATCMTLNQSRTGAGASKGERGESNPTSSNLNSLYSFITLSREAQEVFKQFWLNGDCLTQWQSPDLTDC